MNPFDLFGDLSLLDFQNYITQMDRIRDKENKEKKNKGGKDLNKALMSIRDLLNYMYS